MQSLWSINPVGSVLTSNKQKRVDAFLTWHANFLGFFDGSWSRNGQGVSKGGIGGFLLDEDQVLHFIFSSSSNASSPQDVEREAIQFLFLKVREVLSPLAKIVVCSDYLTLVESFNKARAGLIFMV